MGKGRRLKSKIRKKYIQRDAWK